MALRNIINQNTIIEYGKIIKKDGFTHNQSYSWGCNTSVVNRGRQGSTYAMHVPLHNQAFGKLGNSSKRKVPRKKNIGIKT
eukprot:1410917-Ditylum_brightwellii.AAC.1